MLLLSWESYKADNNLAAKGLLRRGLHASQKEGLASSGTWQTQPVAAFRPSPSTRTSTSQPSRLAEGARGCGRVPSELGGEATSGGESPRASPPLPTGLPSPHSELQISRPRTAMALCCLFDPPFVEFATHSQLHEKQRQAETPSLPQEVSSVKLRRVTEEGAARKREQGLQHSGFSLPSSPGADISKFESIGLTSQLSAPGDRQGLYKRFILLTVLKGHFSAQEHRGDKDRLAKPSLWLQKGSFFCNQVP